MQRRAAEESLTDHGKDNSNGRAHVGDAIRHKPGILGFLRQIGFMGATGCRKGEILNLRWDQVDLGANELRLPDTKTGPRTISLSAEAARVLAAIPGVEGNPFVIPGKIKGKAMRNLNDPWDIVCERAGLEDMRLHDCRHSYASRALALGESLPMIGKLLAHTQVETTAWYAHLAQDSVKESAVRVADSIASDLLAKYPGRESDADVSARSTMLQDVVAQD